MKKCGVKDLQDALSKGADCQVIDVREPGEFASEHIEGSINLPLSQLKTKGRVEVRPYANQRLYLLCKTGNRACHAAEELSDIGDIYVVEGGLSAWSQAGGRVVQGLSKIWSLDRQVRFSVGSLVLSGLILGWLVHPYFFAISLFVACGLILSALTDTCLMLQILSKMPWNQK